VTDKVLYMEDDAAQARLAKFCLERAGYAVEIAVDGKEGLAKAAAGGYEALVVDQTMPGLSGLDVIRTMRLHGPLPPTIMVTGTGDERIAVAAMKAGVSDYVVKDLEGGFVNVLPLVVRRAIDQRRLLLEKQRMEQELNQAQRMRAIGQLAAGIAHEINTPTQYIGDNTRFLQHAFTHVNELLGTLSSLLKAERNHAVTDEMLDDAEAKLQTADLTYLMEEIPLAIRQSLEGLDHVAEIVGAMKEFSHPGMGRKQAVDLRHIISSAATMCCNEWKYVANLVTDFDPDLPQVSCLPTEIGRVLLNLMVNAAHAIASELPPGSESKGTITIRTRRDGPWAEIQVEDTGAGIPAEIRSRVFDPFFTTKEVGRGTGQGLTIAQAIVVKGHGGVIRFESEVGHGTTFIVRLPINGQPDAKQHGAGEEPVEPVAVERERTPAPDETQAVRA
jgi:signal transduction histidine kinase